MFRTSHVAALALALALALGSLACGPTSEEDADGSVPTHCVPENPVHCDYDGDGYTPTQGDCDDDNPNVNPAAAECNANGNGDGLDNNCNQFVDDGCLNADADVDGYTVGQGDCNDADATINPAAYEVVGNNRDDNCDGRTDEETQCDCGVSLNPADVNAIINALELCNSPQIQNAVLNGDARSRAIVPSFGTYQPRAANSCNFVILSTGVAGDKLPQGSDGYGGMDFDIVYSPNPADYPENPNVQFEPTSVNDYTEIRMSLLVPTNARSFSFDFVFLTSEYPEYSCSDYNDTFIAWLKSQAYDGNISFDGSHNTIQVNSAFFGADPAELAGTGYEVLVQDDPFGGGCSFAGLGQPRAGCTRPNVGSTCTVGGTTGWLTTTAPVTPGEMVDLTFSIFDEGDGILDSMVIIDNFRWEVTGSTGPCTDPDGCVD
jgi:hypothetical protein